jgi:LPS-assembly protein
VKVGLTLVATVALLTAWTGPSEAQSRFGGNIDRSAPVLFRADSVQHDRENGIILANGNVEITQGDRTLLADSVSYNQRADRVTASGNVSIVEPGGDVIFAEFAELSGDLKEGTMSAIRIRLTDDALITAASASRTSGIRNEMRKAVYSPCQLCEENPERAPIWQLKAYRVVHDQVAHDIEYEDAFFEFFGYPMLYTPYLSHPDPTVKRRSGFLAPTYGSNTELGPIVRVPYYYVLSPREDFTASLMMTGNEGRVFSGEYRNRFVGGLFVGEGSVTYDGSQGVRGHLDAKLNYDINETWRTGLMPSFASDDTYLRRYEFHSPETLTSRAYLEGFRGRNYAAANAYYFQGLRGDTNNAASPIVHPLADYNFVGEPGWGGSRWTMDANLLALTRREGTDTRRASLKTGWELPFTSSIGEVYRVHAGLQTDGYWVSDLASSNSTGGTESGTTGRAFPQFGVDWRFPFVRNGERSSQTIEPVLGFVVAPNVGENDLIPNEDSVDFELDDTNIFGLNRFGGLDRVEGGQRVYYGVNASVYGAKSGTAEMFLGQSLRRRADSTFAQGSGLNDKLSDIVGRVRLAPTGYLNLLYRFRVDKDGFVPHRNEVTGTIGPPALQLSSTYVFIERNTTTELDLREQVSMSVTSRLTEHWSAQVSSVRDIEQDRTLNYGFRGTYADDCFAFRVSYRRTFTEDRDVRPQNTILFRVILRTLGSFESKTDWQ